MTDESPRDWARVEAILDEVLDAAPEEREVVLERACGPEPGLRTRVETLLRAMERSDSFLDRPAHESAAHLIREMSEGGAPDPDRALPFDRIGPYRLIRELGRGGMGAVYLAERDDEVRRQVAIKLVSPAAAPHLRARFLAERQILANLEHPNIARLYDGGTTPDGTPFLVMELVDGQRIDEYCDASRLDVAGRLALFDTICDAVQFAHQSMVVHRDLKPSNVLVTRDGVVKLLDFGVAKLLDVADAGITQAGFVALTPAYASPEQLRGQAVTVAADVYGLGVLLYELLTGRYPYDLAGKMPFEVARVVHETEPERPSVAARSDAATEADAATLLAGASDRARHRATSPQGLRRRLEGDLDNIVLTALRKEPESRYPSVYHLREDLRRHLDGRPVTARPATLRYRAGKYVRRHRVAVTATGLLLLSLTGGLAATLWQARSAAKQARRAEEVRDFLVGLFESSDPDSTVGRTVTARELLDRGAASLDGRLSTDAALRADMLDVVSRLYRELGLLDAARPLAEAALATRRSGAGSDPAGRAESAGELASVLYEQGEYEEAEKLAREALEVRRRGRRRDPAAYAAALSDVAAVLSVQGGADEADSLYREALAVDRRGGDPEALASHLSNYGAALSRRARWDDARSADEEALSIRRTLHGEESTEVATSLLNLGSVLTAMGEFEQAERTLRECLAIRTKLLGENHAHTALVWHELANVMQQMGRGEEGERAERRALAIRRAVLGPEHPDVAQSLNQLGVNLYFQGRFAEAADLFGQVLGIWSRVYGPRHPSVLTVQTNQAAALRDAGQYAAAEKILRETLAVRREVLGDRHQDVAATLNNLGTLLSMEDKDAEAESMMRQAVSIWQQALGPDHVIAANGLYALGRLLVKERRYEEAELPLRDALRIRAAALDANAPVLANARLAYAECLIGLGRFAEADTLVTAALPILRAQFGDEHENVKRAVRARTAIDRARR